MIINVQRQLIKSLIPRFYSSKLQNSSFAFSNNWSDDNRREFIGSFLIYNEFITTIEEEQFMSEVEPHLKRHIYEKDHWDDVSFRFYNIEPLIQDLSFRQYKASEKQRENTSTKPTLRLLTGLRTQVLIKKVFK